MPTPLTLNTPGRWGVNEQEKNQLLHPNWATVADSLVINDSGNLQCRGALTLVSTDGASAEILRQFVYVNSAGNEVVISTTATKIISGVADLDDAGTDITPAGAPTNGFWQFQNFNGKVVGWQAGHTPIVKTSGDFATITAASGTLPDGDCVCAAFGRLWAVDDDGQTVRYCALLDETKWHADDGGGSIDMRNVWPKGMDRVVAIAAFGGNLVIFGRRSIVIYTDGSGSATGLDPETMYVIDTIEGTGCVARDSVTVIGEGDLVFLSEMGLQSFARLVIQKDNPLETISWQVGDRIADAIAAEVASATDLRTWTGHYILKTGQYMLVDTTNEDVYVFHMGGKTQDDKGRSVTPVTIWDTSVLTNIRGFISLRSGVVYTTGSATHEIYKYDTAASLDQGSAAIDVDYESGWLDTQQQALHLLKMGQITALNPAGIDSAITFKWAADYSTSMTSLTPVNTFDDGRLIFLYDPSGDDIEGLYFKFGFTDTSFGRKTLAQLHVQLKEGRTGFIHKNFNDVAIETYTAPVAPTMTLLTPEAVVEDSGAFTLTVTGTGFTIDSVVYLEGEVRATTFVSATALTVAILAGDVDTAGQFDVQVIDPVLGTSNTLTLTVGSEEAEVFIFAGSSNMRAFGSSVAGLPSNLSGAMTGAKIWDASAEEWLTYEATVNSDQHNSDDAWGPEAEFARQWLIDNPGETIYMLKIGENGAALGTAAAGDSWLPSADQLYDEMTAALTAAKAALQASLLVPSVKAVLLFVGGEDAKLEVDADAYEANLETFVAAVRSDWGDATTKVIVARIMTSSSADFDATVRTAQESVADADANMEWFDTDFYPEATAGTAPHYADTGIVALGYDYYHSYAGDYPALDELAAPTFANVMLLAGFNGADGATAYTSEDAGARTATFAGNAQLDTAAASVVYGSAALLLDGTGDSLTFPDSADWLFGNGAFVIEFTARFTSEAGLTAFINQWNSGANQKSWAIDRGAAGTSIQFSYSTNGSTTTSALAPDFNWFTDRTYRIMVERDTSNDVRIFVNGIMIGKANISTASLHNSTEALRIGALTGFADRDMEGAIDEVRIVKGQHIHGSDNRFLFKTSEFPRS